MQFFRVFCATPGSLEDERQLFHDLVTEANESAGAQSEQLLVPVSVLPNMTDFRPFHAAIEQNVRDCTFFIQIFAGHWGPSNRDFRPYFELALKCFDELSAPMGGLAALMPRPVQSSPDSALIQKALEFRRQLVFFYEEPEEIAPFLGQMLGNWAKGTQ